MCLVTLHPNHQVIPVQVCCCSRTLSTVTCPQVQRVPLQSPSEFNPKQPPLTVFNPSRGENQQTGFTCLQVRSHTPRTFKPDPECTCNPLKCTVGVFDLVTQRTCRAVHQYQDMQCWKVMKYL